jgi:hypothetical protein
MEEDKVFREMIKTENELIDHRLTWLGIFQGLLLAALGFAWRDNKAGAILFVICALGAIVAVSIGIGTYRANKAIACLTAEWDKLRQGKYPDYCGPDVEGVRSHSGWFWWLMPGYAIPWTFVVGWVAIAVICYRR